MKALIPFLLLPALLMAADLPDIRTVRRIWKCLL